MRHQIVVTSASGRPTPCLPYPRRQGRRIFALFVLRFQAVPFCLACHPFRGHIASIEISRWWSLGNKGFRDTTPPPPRNLLFLTPSKRDRRERETTKENQQFIASPFVSLVSLPPRPFFLPFWGGKRKRISAVLAYDFQLGSTSKTVRLEDRSRSSKPRRG